MSPPYDESDRLASSESTELPLERACGTERKLFVGCDSAKFFVGEDTLCGETGLLPLLSKDWELRTPGGEDWEGGETVSTSSPGSCCAWELWELLGMAARGRALSMSTGGLTADVSMVMVGALCRRTGLREVGESRP